jgi:hypothetical protein
VAGGLFVGAGLVGAIALLQRASRTAFAATAALAVVAHGVLLAGLAPRLEPLWMSERTSDALARAGLHPRSGLVPGPAAVSGYAEPSLVFALGSGTGLGGAEEAAEAVAQGRTAVVEAADLPAFKAELAERGVAARSAGQVVGTNYSKGDPAALIIFAPVELETRLEP